MSYNFKIIFPLPPSLNQAYQGTGIKGNRGLQRTKQYEEWIHLAGVFFRQQYPYGMPEDKILKGRLRVQYVLTCKDKIRRDCGNYEKIVADFMEGKFYLNDSQIDEIQMLRRIDPTLRRNLLHVFITEIEDKRSVDLFNPA